METIAFQVTEKEKIPFLMDLLSHFDFIENIKINGETEIIEEKQEETEEELSKEMKELLKQRIENYKKAPEKVKTWEEVEHRLMKKYN